MKVLHVIPSIAKESGGPSLAVLTMCRALKRESVDVTIVTTDHGLNKNDDGHEAQTVIFPSQLGESFKYSRPLAKWLDENVNEFDLVHIHAVFNHACIAAARACSKHRVPYVVRPLGTLSRWSMEQKSLRKSLFLNTVGKRMLSGAAAVHYTSIAEQESTEPYLNLRNGRVIPLSIERESLTDHLTRDEFFARWPDLETHPYLLLLSRIDPKKNIELLLDVFASVAEEEVISDWRLVLAGDGRPEYILELKERVCRNDLEEKILFTGWLNGKSKNSLLERAKLLVLPSYNENFGLCVLEAITCEVPVIISPHVGLADEIQTAGAGWIAELTVNDLQQAIRHAVTDAEERSKRSKAARVLGNQFSPGKCAKDLVALYDNILTRGVRRSIA